MMTKANIAWWIEWHWEVKLWAWPEGARWNIIGVCRGTWVGVFVCVCSPERASPHLRSSAHCSVCPKTHMQIWHGSANNLHEFVYYGFMSLNLNVYFKKDSCVDESVLKCACGFRRGGACWPLVIWLGRGLSVFAFTFMASMSLHLCVHDCPCTCCASVCAPMRWSIWGDSFTSWSQIWISSDEILFPLDWSPSPLIPAHELHD